MSDADQDGSDRNTVGREFAQYPLGVVLFEPVLQILGQQGVRGVVRIEFIGDPFLFHTSFTVGCSNEPVGDAIVVGAYFHPIVRIAERDFPIAVAYGGIFAGDDEVFGLVYAAVRDFVRSRIGTPDAAVDRHGQR